MGDEQHHRRISDGVGPEDPIRVTVTMNELLNEQGQGVLVPPSPGSTTACLHTGVVLAVGDLAYPIGLEFDLEAIGNWVDRVRQAQDEADGGTDEGRASSAV